MGRTIKLCLAAALVVGGLAVSPSAGAYTHHRFPVRTQPSQWVMGYDMCYESGFPTGEIDWNDLTHIAFGAALPRANGTLDLGMYMGTTTCVPLAQEISAAAKEHGVQPVLMLGGAGMHDRFIKAIKGHRATLVTSVFKALDKLGFTGVDLDLEPLNAADRAPFTRFVRALKKFDPNVTLTFPVGPFASTSFDDADESGTASYLATTLGGLVDRIGLMSYDMSGPYDGWSSWHFAPLDGENDCSGTPCYPMSVSYNIQKLLDAGVPASKLVMGIGFYGACWRPETGPGQDVTVNYADPDLRVSDNRMAYRNIMSDYFSLMTYHYDTETLADQAELISKNPDGSAKPVGPESCSWISYEDGNSIAAKGAYAQAKGLGGAMIWTLPQGHVSGADPLLQAVHSSFVP